MKKILLPFFIIYITTKSAFAASVSGGGSGDAGEIVNPMPFSNLSEFLIAVSGQLYLVAIPIVTIMILYGAFLILTAGGDPGRFERGKKAILYAVIGFVVVLVAGGIPTIIQEFAGS